MAVDETPYDDLGVRLPEPEEISDWLLEQAAELSTGTKAKFIVERRGRSYAPTTYSGSSADREMKRSYTLTKFDDSDWRILQLYQPDMYGDSGTVEIRLRGKSPEGWDIFFFSREDDEVVYRRTDDRDGELVETEIDYASIVDDEFEEVLREEVESRFRTLEQTYQGLEELAFTLNP